MPEEIADYVIVGGGSAGCVLANRLSDEGGSVLLLEAGKWDRDPLIHIPVGIGKIFPSRLHDWGYFMQPDPALDARGIECARGKVIGGSSSINVMAYVRGHRSDYDRWARNGAQGWSYAEVLPYFQRSEDWEDGADAYRGAGGPLTVQRSRYRDPLVEAFIEAGEEAGFGRTDDYNGAVQDGFSRVQETIRNGRRCSAAVAYLHPALRRPGLRVLVEAQATRVLIEDGRAAGLEFRRGGVVHVARARREIILCGGVIDTPKLLMLSGIGDPAELARHGIAPRIENAAVGRALQDHLSVIATWRRRTTSPFERAMRYDRLAHAMLRSRLGLDGFASDVPIGATGFLRTQAGLEAPDVQFLFLAAPFPARPHFRPLIAPVPDGFGCRVALLRPESRGAVRLASADPDAAPLIEPNFLATAKDRDTLRAGLALARQVVAQEAMAPYRGAEIAPGPAANDDAALDAFIRRTAVTVHHPAGTCGIGRVVDAALRLRGVDGLRIADASVMPDLVGGNINAVVMMIAEKAADLIRDRRPLPAAARPETQELADVP